MKKLVAVLGSFVGLGLGLSAPASADDYGYIRVIREHGIEILNEPIAIDDAHRTCTLLGEGDNFPSVAQALVRDNPGLSYADANFEAVAARRYVCPR